MFKEFMGLAVAESTQQPAETFNFKPCTSTLKGICLLLTVISLNEPEEAKLGPPEVLTTESRLCFKKDNMNFNYCSELTVRVLIPLQWKELSVKTRAWSLAVQSGVQGTGLCVSGAWGALFRPGSTKTTTDSRQTHHGDSWSHNLGCHVWITHSWCRLCPGTQRAM